MPWGQSIQQPQAGPQNNYGWGNEGAATQQFGGGNGFQGFRGGMGRGRWGGGGWGGGMGMPGGIGSLPPPPGAPPLPGAPPAPDPSQFAPNTVQSTGYASGGEVSWRPLGSAIPATGDINWTAGSGTTGSGIAALPAITAPAAYKAPVTTAAAATPAASSTASSDDFATKLMKYGKQNQINGYAAQLGPQGMAYALKNGWLGKGDGNQMPTANTPTEKLLASLYSHQGAGGGGGYRQPYDSGGANGGSRGSGSRNG
jgi:hypothetical protein